MAIRLTESRLRQIVREEVKRSLIRESIVDIVAQSNYATSNPPFIANLQDKRAGFEAAVAELWPSVKSVISPRVIKNAIAKKAAGERVDLTFRIMKAVPDFDRVARRNGLMGIHLATVIEYALLNGVPEAEVMASSPAPAASGGVTDMASFRKALRVSDPEAFEWLESGDFEGPGEIAALIRMSGKKMGLAPDVIAKLSAEVRRSMMM